MPSRKNPGNHRRVTASISLNFLNTREYFTVHPFQILILIFAVFSVAAFVLLMRWESIYFKNSGKRDAWIRVRIATIPIALITAAVVIIPVRSTPGMEGLAVFYFAMLFVAPWLWFGCHWIVGKCVKPSLAFNESMLIAGSLIVLGFILVLLAHQLQSVAWFALRFLGIAE